MHRNDDTRQVTIDSELFGLLMSSAKIGAGEEGPEAVALMSIIERHAIRFNRHVRDNIYLAMQPGFVLQHKQQYAKALRQWASCTGKKAYLYMTGDAGVVEYYLPVMIMGRSELGPEGLRYVVVRPCSLNTEQEQSLSRNRRVTGGVIQSGSKIKLTHHPITGPTLIHASWMNDRPGPLTFAVLPAFLKLELPEGSHECHGGILDGVWRTHPVFHELPPSPL